MKNGKEKNWAELSWQEKREVRFDRWLSPGIPFSDPEAEKKYKANVTRFVKAIKHEEPDRVPVMLPAQFIPAPYAGTSLKTVMYDYDELKRAWLKFVNDFEMDSFIGAGLVLPGKMLEIIDYKVLVWPGHGLADNVASYQYLESENMKHEEYDDFINDPSDFLLRGFLPRIAGSFSGLSKLTQLTPFVGIPIFYLLQFADQEVRASVQAILDAAQEGMKWMGAVMEVGMTAMQKGVPTIWGGMCGAPFDLLGDMMRGTKGIMIDMFQRPDKLNEAMERMVPILVQDTINSANISGCPIIFMPLHKGTGGFMSNKQFEIFYWPTLKKVMLGLIEDGLVPLPYAEGDYTQRLEIIKDMPQSSVIWFFEQMDMAVAKKIVGGNACIAGNIPGSVLYTKSPKDVKEACRKLIETCAKGGGYILAGGVHMDDGNPENLRAIMEAAKEYGVYN